MVRKMETVQLSIDPLSREAEVLDLGNVVNALNGVAHVAIEAETGQVTVDYDPSFGSPESIRACITGSGYPLRSTAAK